MDTPTLVGTGFLIVGLVVWIVCAVLSYRLAPQRHRSQIGWTVAAVIFGPLAYFALYVLPPGR
jgi:hypothetical protein